MPPRSAAKPPTKTSAKAAHSSRTTRKKAAPKQPLPVADRLKRLFTSLCAQIDGGHFANAIKTCDKSASSALFSFERTLSLTMLA